MSENFVEPGSFAALQHEHAELGKALASIGRVLTVPHRKKAEMEDLIGQLADHVETHFHHEEDGGYFSAALKKSPRLTDQANILLEQHTALAEQIQKLRMLARSGVETDGWWKLLEEQFADFKARLLEHERKENELLQDAFGVDIGTAD